MYKKSKIYNVSRDNYDPDAVKDPCNLPVELCGNFSNKLADINHKIMVIRGIIQAWYFPESEENGRQQYAVTLNTWHFDYGWQNITMLVILTSSIVFYRGF